MAAAEAFGCDTENLVINRTSFQRLRKNLEKQDTQKFSKTLT